MGKRNVVQSSFIKFMAFIVLIIAALVAVIQVIDVILVALTLPALFAPISGILTMIKDIALFLAIALGAWEYVANKARVYRTIYWTCVAIFAVGMVFGTLGLLGIF